jgi:hypothetical protein
MFPVMQKERAGAGSVTPAFLKLAFQFTRLDIPYFEVSRFLDCQ